MPLVWDAAGMVFVVKTRSPNSKPVLQVPYPMIDLEAHVHTDWSRIGGVRSLRWWIFTEHRMVTGSD